MNTSRNAEIEKSFEIGKKERNILRQIGYYYHNIYHADLNKTYTEIKNLGIHKIVIEDDTIYICLERPGLLIGVRGSNLEALQKYLLSKDIKEKISIVEVLHPAEEFLTAWQYAYMDCNEI